MDYSKLNAAELNDIVAAEHPDAWGAAAKAWGKTAVLANNVEAGISSASGEITVWRQSNDSAAQAAFDQRINRDLDVLRRWNQFGVIVMLRLQAVASVLGAAQPAIRGFADARAEQVRIRDAAADDIDARNRATQEIDRLDDLARGRMQLVAQLMRESLTDKDPERPGRWVGPRAAPGGASDPGPDDGSQAPGVQGPGADSGGGGAAPGNPDPGTPEQPSSPKTPEAKDPVEEAGKLIDVIGKGIDLTGKVPENLDKWLTLAQHAKDLLGADTPSTSTPDSLVPQGLPTDEPALAGGAGTEPILNPTHYPPSTPHSGGLGNSGLGSIGMPLGGGGGGGYTGLPSGTTDRGTQSLRSATTAGGAGAEPTLSGKTATTGATGTQSSTPPMYPPMNGAGAGAPTSRGEIRPGAAAAKSGFTVPTESTASERLRRQGVQSDLQGRTNGEQRTPSGAPPPHRRRSSARPRRTAVDDVLDEELWKL